MKKLLILVIASFVFSPALFAQTKAGRVDTVNHSKFYTCPKHSDIVSNKPGKCPTCGMDLSLSPKEQMKASETRRYNCPIHLAVTSHNPAKCPQCGRKMNLSPKEQMKADVAKTYTCPMHPGVALDKEGKCPKCGEALVEKKRNR